MDVFSPAVGPSLSGTSKSTTAAVKTAQFGDGYSQRAKDGLNSISRQLSLTWENLTFDQASDLDDFFTDHGGDEAFLYQISGDDTQRMWTCASWRNGYEGGVSGSYSATFQEAFDLAT